MHTHTHNRWQCTQYIHRLKADDRVALATRQVGEGHCFFLLAKILSSYFTFYASDLFHSAPSLYMSHPRALACRTHIFTLAHSPRVFVLFEHFLQRSTASLQYTHKCTHNFRSFFSLPFRFVCFVRTVKEQQKQKSLWNWRRNVWACMTRHVR